MLKIIAKVILTILIAVLDYAAIANAFDSADEFEGNLPSVSHWLTPGLLAFILILFFAVFTYRFFRGAKGWGWFLALNILLILVAIFAYSPLPGA